MDALLHASAGEPAPKKKRAKRGLPKHITIPNFDGYQVRVVRDGVEHSKSFPWSAGGKAMALLDAVAWRDRLLSTLPEAGNAKGGYRSKPLSHKTSWDRVGVVRTVGCDRRRSLTVQYVRFSVSWVDATGRARVKTFQAGRADSITQADEVHTSLTAEAFRSEWEFCQRNGERFEPWRYDSWRKDRLYPFDPAERQRRNAALTPSPQPASHVHAAQQSAASHWIASVSQEAARAG